MDELCKQLNVKRVYSPVYTPEANGRLEAWHHFFKACVAKHICGNVAIIWRRARAGSPDLADITTFNIGGGTSEISQF